MTWFDASKDREGGSREQDEKGAQPDHARTLSVDRHLARLKVQDVPGSFRLELNHSASSKQPLRQRLEKGVTTLQSRPAGEKRCLIPLR